MGNKQSGQALLIVVLVMVVSLTVSLAVVSRSVTNLRTSTEEENSQRAFSAAEAGVERWLKTGATSAIDLGNNAAISQVNIVSVSGNQFLVNGGNMVEKDDGADVWLVPHNDDGTPNFSSPWSGNLTFYWGSSSDVCNSNPSINTMAALEIIVISGTQLSPTSKRYVFDPCGGRRGSNNFTSQGPGRVIGGRSFAYSTGAIAVSSGLIARVVPLYSSASIGVVGSGSIALPSQGNRIESTGVSGGTSRKIAFYQGYPTLALEFFYILFSPR